MRKVYSIVATSKNGYLGNFVLSGNNCELEKIFNNISQPNLYKNYILMDVTSSPVITGWDLKSHYENNSIEYEKYFSKVLKPGRKYWWIPSDVVRIDNLLEIE